MNALLFALPLVVALLGLIGWRLKRRWRRGAVAVPLHLPPAGARLDEAHSRTAPETGVWRPPPRQQLLRRQQEEAQQRANRDDSTQRLSGVRRRGPTGWSPPQPMPTLSSRDDSARVPRALTIDQTPVAEPGSARPSRLGRKRQGLDSLITEWPQAPKDASSEP